MIPTPLHDHLIRLLIWGVLSVVGGLSLRKRPFGVMTAAWGGVNLVIAVASLRGGPPGAGFREFLAFNLGLDLAYVGVGVTMALLAKSSVRVKEFGWAVVVQGAALFLLDTLLFWRIGVVSRL